MLDKQRLRSFLLGGLTGILAGVLLAPRSGKETRGTIRDRAGEARDRGRETYFDTQERMREHVSATREGAARYPEQPVSHPPRTEPAEEVVSERPVLRDVSRDVPADDESGGEEEVSRSEELRRKVRETRDRLRARVDGPVEKGTGGGEDGVEE